MKTREVSEHLIEHAAALAEEVLSFNLSKIDFPVPEAIIERGKVTQTAFMRFLGNAITMDSYDAITDAFHEWHQANVKSDTSLYDKVSSLIKPYPVSRLFLNEKISGICADYGLSLEEAAKILNRLNYIQDLSISESILAFEAYKNSINKRTREQLMELSAPVVGLKDGIAVLPLIGSVDFERAEHFSNKVIPKITQMDVETLIIDFSGIVSVNPEVAGYLFNINNVLVLLGIQVVITGMRPDLANSIVGQGISFKSFKTFLNVREALEAWEANKL
ncbi:MAG TPA: STAS domain-containing protein [Bacillales bacterium]|nr:STAS domain-containing protein [Bacillales bacterium]